MRSMGFNQKGKHLNNWDCKKREKEIRREGQKFKLWK